MKYFTQFTLLFIFLFSLSCSSEKEQRLVLNGKVIGTDTKSILLEKPNQDMRFDSIIVIPVKNGSFHYESKLKNPEAVNLYLGEAMNNGGGRYLPLFLENTHMDVTIYSEENFDHNIVEGGDLNAEFENYRQKFDDKFNDRINPIQDSINVLFENDEYNSDKAKLLFAKLKDLENQDKKVIVYKKLENLRNTGGYLSPIAKQLEDKLQPIYEEQKLFQQKYIENNPSIVSYYFFVEDLIYNKEHIDIELAKKNYQLLSKANPAHPYNDLSLKLLNSIENIKVGKHFTDFSAPDLEGNIIKLSDQIKGKIALLDLWATWCGPCIAKSKSMIPLYNEYKDKGFTIVGVAGEFKNTDRLEKFLEKEKWEWINLVELDRQNNIWQKYGVERSGGGIFLIDENGIILAKKPTAKEVRTILASRLD